MKDIISFLIVLFWLPSISLAQNISQTLDTKRFYAAAYLNSSNYLFNFPKSVPQVRTVSPWRVDVGTYVTSRIAVQAGFMASWLNDESSSTGFGPGQRTDIILKEGGVELAAPILVRYCFIKQPVERLKFDAIGGVTFGYSNPTLTTTRKVNGQIVEQTKTSGGFNARYYTLGLGVRWMFSPRWEGVFDWTFSRNIAPVDDSVYLVAGTRNGITRSLGLGTRYRFDLAKKPKRGTEIITE